jgi:hypothetical protein
MVESFLPRKTLVICNFVLLVKTFRPEVVDLPSLLVPNDLTVRRSDFNLSVEQFVVHVQIRKMATLNVASFAAAFSASCRQLVCEIHQKSIKDHGRSLCAESHFQMLHFASFFKFNSIFLLLTKS